MCDSRKRTLFPPRTKMVTALDCLVPSTTSMRSWVVPNTTSFTCVHSPGERGGQLPSLCIFQSALG